MREIRGAVASVGGGSSHGRSSGGRVVGVRSVKWPEDGPAVWSEGVSAAWLGGASGWLKEGLVARREDLCAAHDRA